MGLDLRAPRRDEAAAVYALNREAFTSDFAERDTWLASRDMAHFLGAFVDGELVAITETVPLGQHFGGRRVPAGAVASVAVRPDQRRRGIGRMLLTRALDDMRARELAISTLHPATTRFYRGLGWEIGGRVAVHTVPCRALASLPPGEPEGLRPGGARDLDAVQACYRRVAAGVDGALDRDDAWWRRTWHLDAGYRYLYVLESGGEVRGYTLYDQVKDGLRWGFAITVHELVADDSDVARALWRHIGGHAAQVETVTIVGPPPDGLLLLLPEQEVRELAPNHWMTRIVDAPAAIAARGYSPAARATVELTLIDPVAPYNDGRFVLEVGDGKATLSPGGRGRARLTVNGLASMFTGWASARMLAATGLLRQAAASEIAALDAIFAGARPTLLDDF